MRRLVFQPIVIASLLVLLTVVALGVWWMLPKADPSLSGQTTMANPCTQAYSDYDGEIFLFRNGQQESKARFELNSTSSRTEWIDDSGNPYAIRVAVWDSQIELLGQQSGESAEGASLKPELFESSETIYSSWKDESDEWAVWNV